MEEEKKVSEETQVKVQEANPYSKVRDIDDAETEAFAKGELTKFHAEQREKEAEAATEQKDTDASKETAESIDQGLVSTHKLWTELPLSIRHST